jgi:hypothetical protein
MRQGVLMDEIRRIADAVLYEGYVLWPYTRSATKNQKRWTFGGVYPPAHSAAHPDDPARMRTECLVQAKPTDTVDISVRFLHVVQRQVTRATHSGLEPVDELWVSDKRYLSWDEATERQIVATSIPIGELQNTHRVAISIQGGSAGEQLVSDEQQRAGALVRSWAPLEGDCEVFARQVCPGVFRLCVEIHNATAWQGKSRDEALRQTFVSTHTALCTSGQFVSATDPPGELAEQTQQLANEGTWPVLVGEQGEHHRMLSSPIILSDYPRVAPESLGDLFDGGEIDSLLILNILALTDSEKAEMRDSDPRAREILDRVSSMSAEELMRLHGAIREFAVVRP